jgi:non-heme chloroperoxidase
MATFETNDGTWIYYNDWGKGQTIVFSHGWPLSADAFEDQMFYLASRGYRCIAHDRRGHGRSSQTWHGNDLNTYADDLAQLVEKLDLKDAVHVGHSTGGGEVARYIGRHGTKRVAKAVLIGAIPPLMLKTPAILAAFRSRCSMAARQRCRRPIPVLEARRYRRARATRSGCKGM